MVEKQRDPGRMRQIRQTWEDYNRLLLDGAFTIPEPTPYIQCRFISVSLAYFNVTQE